jgi:hypothetical protein
MSEQPNAQTVELNGATRTQPLTSKEFLESLKDGREIWIYGERVKDVTTHPAFRNTVRMLRSPQERVVLRYRHWQWRLHAEIL